MPTDQELIKIVPSRRQLSYQATEFYAFFHFGMNTYTNREWGDGTENPQIFNPTEFDADQWVTAAQNAGMKGVIPQTLAYTVCPAWILTVLSLWRPFFIVCRKILLKKLFIKCVVKMSIQHDNAAVLSVPHHVRAMCE